MRSPLGEKIYRLRKEKGLTLEELADVTESSKSYIWELENRNPPRPSADKISRVARALGVTQEFLLDAEQDSPTPAVHEEAFFREYRRMDDETKEKIRDLVKMWGKKP